MKPKKVSGLDDCQHGVIARTCTQCGTKNHVCVYNRQGKCTECIEARRNYSKQLISALRAQHSILIHEDLEYHSSDDCNVCELINKAEGQ